MRGGGGVGWLRGREGDFFLEVLYALVEFPRLCDGQVPVNQCMNKIVSEVEPMSKNYVQIVRE